jgi:hypothetical protein
MSNERYGMTIMVNCCSVTGGNSVRSLGGWPRPWMLKKLLDSLPENDGFRKAHTHRHGLNINNAHRRIDTLCTRARRNANVGSRDNQRRKDNTNVNVDPNYHQSTTLHSFLLARQDLKYQGVDEGCHFVRARVYDSIRRESNRRNLTLRNARYINIYEKATQIVRCLKTITNHCHRLLQPSTLERMGRHARQGTLGL